MKAHDQSISTDVLVVGGGPAGIAAAVASARLGAETWLIERYGFLGGMATIAGVTAMCGLYARDTNQHPERVIGGVAWEIIRRLDTFGVPTEPVPVGRSWLVPYDPVSYKDVMDSLVTEAGCRLLLHSLAIGVDVEGTRIGALRVRTKGGTSIFRPKVVVDATGDADVAAMAGASYRLGDGGIVQAPTLTFHMVNVDWAQAGAVSREQLKALMEQAVDEGMNLPRVTGSIWPTGRTGEVFCNMTRVSRQRKPLDLTTSDDLTFAELEGRRQVRLYRDFLRRYVPGFAAAFVTNSGPQIGIRETRLIDGQYVLSDDDVREGRRFDDGIARCAWPMEVHGEGAQTTWEWLSDGSYYEIPYRSLLPKGFDNLIVAGRCLSATHTAQASARVSAPCLALGQAAGVAAYIAITNRQSVGAINVGDLRTFLRKQDALI